MKTTTCEQQREVVAAFAHDRLDDMPELRAHADDCGACGRAIALSLRDAAVAAGLIGAAAPPGGPPDDRRRLEDEAAILAGFAAPIDVAPWLDPPAAANDEGSDEGGDAHVGPSHAPARRRWPALAALAATVTLAAGAALLVNDEAAPDPAPTPEAAERLRILLRRGQALGMELATGDLRCTGVRDPAGWPFRMGLAEPCRWRPSEQLFTINVRVEPEADARYLAVLSRDDAGEVTRLYPDPGAPVRPLAVTRDRASARCVEDLCWLEGGRYDVRAGSLEVVAVFSTTPLPIERMVRDWAPTTWAGPDRLVERFELEVVP